MKSKLPEYVRRAIILFYAAIILIVSINAYENKTEIFEWCKTQVKVCKRDCLIWTAKQQFLRLQQKYGPEGAIQA